MKKGLSTAEPAWGGAGGASVPTAFRLFFRYDKTEPFPFSDSSDKRVVRKVRQTYWQ